MEDADLPAMHGIHSAVTTVFADAGVMGRHARGAFGLSFKGIVRPILKFQPFAAHHFVDGGSGHVL